MIQLIIGAGLGLGGVAAAVAIKRYNEAERERDGNLVVVPEGSQPLVGTK